MDTFGTYLRAKREEKKITLEEIARETNIKLDYLQAIENESLGLFSDKVYARIFLKTYAEYIGEDPEMVIDMFHNSTHFRSFSRQYNGTLKHIEQQNQMPPLQRRGQGLLVHVKNSTVNHASVFKRLLSVFASLVALGIIVFGLYLWLFTDVFSENLPELSFLQPSTECTWVKKLVFRGQPSIWEIAPIHYRFDAKNAFKPIFSPPFPQKG